MQQITPTELYRQRLRDHQIKTDESQLRVLSSLQRLYDEITQQKKILVNLPFMRRPECLEGLYLYGDVGRGKSMLMDLFYESLPESVTRRRTHFHAFMIEAHYYMHQARKADSDTESVILQFAKQVSKQASVLCFDEFHVTDIADAMILGRLFTSLFRHGVIIVTTSNWQPDRLYEGGLQRELFLPFIDLLQEKLEVVELNGPVDYRLQCLKDSGVYFWPLGKATQEKAYAVFDRLTDGAEPHSEKLSVKGRDIEVSCVAKDVAKFSFYELCERPRGAEDYLMIASSYHTVFLDGVPKLGDDQENEAKRFVILIDILYEHKVRLVLSADAPVDKLYSGHDHEFEFQRTFSRLMEMQGDDYLAV